MAPRLEAFIAVLFWGVSFVATKLVVGQIAPVALTSARALAGLKVEADPAP